MNLGVEASERKWLRCSAHGETTPPPCEGARCVVMNKMIYSYGGVTEDGTFLGVVYCLDPKNMKWIKVHIEGKTKPAPRTDCSLCVIGSVIVMFGGCSSEGWCNEIYKLVIDTERQGVYFDLKLSGSKPKALKHPAMVSIDQNRAILFEVDIQRCSFVLNLHNESWTTIDFELTSRRGHGICQLVKEGFKFKEKPLPFLIGGLMISSFADLYVLGIDDDHKEYQMNVGELFKTLYFQASHCVQKKDGKTDLFVYQRGFHVLRLDSRNELFIEFERELHLSITRHLQQKRAELEKEVESSRQEVDQKQAKDHCRFENEKISIMQALASTKTELKLCKNVEIPAIRKKLEKEVAEVQCHLQRRNKEISTLSEEMLSCQSKASKADHLLQEKIDEVSTMRRKLEDSQRCLEQKTQDLESSKKKAAAAHLRLKEQEKIMSVMKCDLASCQDEVSVTQLLCNDKISALRQEYESKADELENHLQQKNSDNVAMRQELEQKAQDLASSEEKAAEAQRCIKEQEDKISVMKRDLTSEAKRQLAQHHVEISALRQEYSFCQSKAAETDCLLQHKFKEVSTMRRELEDSQRCLKQKTQDLASSEKKAAEAQRCIKEQENKISVMRRDLAQRDDKISALKEESSFCKSKAAEEESLLQKNIATMTQDLEQKDRDLASCKKKEAEAQRYLKQLRQDYETSRRKVDELASLLQQKNSDNFTMSQELENSQLRLRQKTEDLASSEKKAADVQLLLKKREKKISVMECDLASCRDDVAVTQRQLSQRNDEISALRQKYKTSAAEFESNLQQKNRENFAMRQELEQKAQDLASRAEKAAEEEISTLRQDLSSSRRQEQDHQRSLENKKKEISTLRDKLSSALERLDVQTENKEETNTKIGRLFLKPNLYYVLILLSVIAAICIRGGIGDCISGFTTTSSPTKSSPVSFYDARWNDFSRIVCEAGFSKWQNMGDRLGYNWHSVQAIRESGQGSKNHCRFLLQKYVDENGDSREGRNKVVDVCIAIQIGGRLKDIVKGKGYSI